MQATRYPPPFASIPSGTYARRKHEGDDLVALRVQIPYVCTVCGAVRVETRNPVAPIIKPDTTPAILARTLKRKVRSRLVHRGYVNADIDY